MINSKNPAIILIGGSGRSGTNITKQILGIHSRVHAMPFEHRFTVDPDGFVDFYETLSSAWSPFIASSRLKRLRSLLRDLGKNSFVRSSIGHLVKTFDPSGRWLSPPRYHAWNLSKYFRNYDELSKKLMNDLTDFSYPAAWVGSPSLQWQSRNLHSSFRSKKELAAIFGKFINELVVDCLDKYQKDVFVEDNTWNILFAEQLLEFTPQAKLIHVYRDPRDVVSSLMNQRWAPDSAETTALWYKDLMEKWFAIRSKLPKKNYMEFKLEDLTRDPKNTISNLCHFAEIPFEPAMLEIDLDHSHQGRWKQDLKETKSDQLEQTLEGVIQKLGYK